MTERGHESLPDFSGMGLRSTRMATIIVNIVPGRTFPHIETRSSKI